MVRQEKHVIIIGGGASGALLACHLLREPLEALTVTLIEKRASLGLGTAYSTSHPQHLLNVRASNMSAFADDPGHFQRWLSQRTALAENDHTAGMIFAPRKVYGQYLSGLLEELDAKHDRLVTVRGGVSKIEPITRGVSVQTSCGKSIVGDYAVLATGFAETVQDDPAICSPWAQPVSKDLSPDAAVLILGSGLTMVDLVVELRSAGHSGPIFAMSRRGVVSQTHRMSKPISIARQHVPFGASLSTLWRWVRGLAKAEDDAGRDWRSAIDGIRPYTAELWRRLPIDSKRRFLRHARPWWDIHRHRMSPAIASHIAEAQRAGQFTLMASKVTSIKSDGAKATVKYKRRGDTQTRSLDVARVFPCMGVSTNPASCDNAAIQSLLAQGLARPDELALGLDIDESCALRAAAGHASDRIFAVGPITRGAYWEMIAVPDIRLQCAALAKELRARIAQAEALPLAS